MPDAKKEKEEMRVRIEQLKAMNHRLVQHGCMLATVIQSHLGKESRFLKDWEDAVLENECCGEK